jgi:metal-responsive CopG/Arc/MetJ family transcriptional regulator
LVRDALREHLQRLEIRAKEEQERAGYAKYPQTKEEIDLWQGESAWLEE